MIQQTFKLSNYWVAVFKEKFQNDKTKKKMVFLLLQEINLFAFFSVVLIPLVVHLVHDSLHLCTTLCIYVNERKITEKSINFMDSRFPEEPNGK